MSYIVIASSNAHKVEEYRALLKDQDVELQSLADYPGFPGVEENGNTFAENASLKAAAVSKYCDAAAFADTDVTINTEGANALIDWLLSDEAAALIEQYGVEQYGEQLFFLLNK